MVDILCLGEPMFELAQIDATTWQEGIGGDVSNVAIAAARQGVSAGMISRLGNDSFAASIRAQWERDGVEHHHVKAVPDAPTGIYFIRQGDDGHYFEYRRSESAAAGIRPEDLPDLSCKILHLSGITMAISQSSAQTALEAIARAKRGGALVSYDPNLRTNLTSLEEARAAQNEVFKAGCDIALPGLEDARLLTDLERPEDINAYYLELGAQYVALTLGASGALISTQEGTWAVPPRPAELVDASGAGDCFDGCFLARICMQDTPLEAGKYAVEASSLSVQEYGAVTSIPRAADVVLKGPTIDAG